MSNETEGRRLTPAELTEACYHAAATSVVAYVLGAGYTDIFVNDCSDGWPMASKVFVDGWGKKPPADALERTAMVYEAGGLAVSKLRGTGVHVIVGFLTQPRFLVGGDLDTRALIGNPAAWAAIEPLAAYIEDNYEGDGCYGAMAKHDDEDAAIGLLKDAGLYPGWWFDHRDDDDDDGCDDEGGPSPDSDDGVRKVPEFEKA